MLRKARFFALIVGLAAQYGQGQTADAQAGVADDVAAAHCAYVSNDSCAIVNTQADADGRVVAQVPRHPSGPPMRRARPIGRPPGYPGFGPPEHPGHALIGAVLLGGLGGSLAYNTHPNGQSGPNVAGALFGGGFGAVIGWIIGDHIGGHRSGYHSGGWHDQDENASVLRTKEREARKAWLFRQCQQWEIRRDSGQAEANRLRRQASERRDRTNRLFPIRTEGSPLASYKQALPG